MRIHSSEADGGLSKHRCSEVEMRGQNSCCRSEVVALLCLWENIGDIVALVTPGIHVNRSKENSKCRMNDNAELRHGLRKAETRREIMGIGVFETFWKTILSSYEDRGHPV